MQKPAWLFLITASCFSLNAFSQNVNLDSMLDVQTQVKDTGKIQRAEATFMTTRLIDGHTVETTQAGVLDLKISHRFGQLNDGFYNLFGLDLANIRIGMDYGLTNRLTVGGGRSSFEKQYDLFLKYRLLRQAEGNKGMPLSVTLFTSAMLQTDTALLKAEKKTDAKLNTQDKLSYAYQVLIARKFTPGFSFQLMPSLIHENLVDSSFNPNDIFAIGAGAKLRVTKRSGISVEYYYVLPGTKFPGTYNTFSIGYEIETAGHVFQVHLSNSTGMTERAFIAENPGRWKKGDIHFGFNISRNFTLRKAKKLQQR
ncbi:DUF5777 family beta-barrel protein [Parafilimonas terrae]|uniref:DUF5777 domain-containing protein n=1 Tax=Parafilimonas terrae TaxID=1465490 RepID=A0A1I5YQJ9_9BACT|nr:DUF5777 family beta-barrel protein [Parafilimonas terrae]SFQ46519.1 hypothetical protein SAMN05444277_113123 [Parafilimonas terrae]